MSGITQDVPKMDARRSVGFVLLLFMALFVAPVVEAATIDVTPMGAGKQALVTVTGPFEYSDIDQFRTKTSLISKAVVALASPGGNLSAGLEIGTMLRLKGFISFVPDGSQCASACALAWLGGAKRLMGSTAQVGFHSASIVKDGVATETSVGNALVGAYLNRIGLPDQAVVFITQAAPDDITWLSIEDAERLGIDVELFTPTAPSRMPPTVPAPSTSLSLPSFARPGGQKPSERYSRSGCGSIVDAETGLEWVVGPDTHTDWSSAVDWAHMLKSCGKSWAMPSSGELRALYDRQHSAGSGYLTGGRKWPAHIHPIFSAIGAGSWVWTDRERGQQVAIAVNLNQGIDVSLPQKGFDGTVRVFAVNRDNGIVANVVRSFYDALASGDGDKATKLLLPEKRYGVLAPDAISAYYSQLVEPLTLTAFHVTDPNNVLVRYHFRSAKMRCDGSAIITTTTRGIDVFVAHIKALNGC